MRGPAYGAAADRRAIPCGISLATSWRVTSRLVMTVALAYTVFGAGIGAAQTRFEGTEPSSVAGVNGLRVVTVHDRLLQRCYLVFVTEPPQGPLQRTSGVPDVQQARAARDGRLAELLHGYEQDRSAIPGTIIPNPLQYDWLADAAQLEFALSVLQQQFARLEEQLDRLADASRTTMTTTQVPCGPPEGRASP